MNKTYRLHPNIILAFALVFVSSCLILFFLGSSDIGLSIGLGAIIVIFPLAMGIYMAAGKVVLDNEGVIVGVKFYFDARRSLKWNEIGHIQYAKVLFLKEIRLVALGNKYVRITRNITLLTLMRNYSDLLKEIIMHTYDETKVDDRVVKLAGMTKEQLGNRKSTVLVRIVE